MAPPCKASCCPSAAHSGTPTAERAVSCGLGESSQRGNFVLRDCVDCLDFVNSTNLGNVSSSRIDKLETNLSIARSAEKKLNFSQLADARARRRSKLLTDSSARCCEKETMMTSIQRRNGRRNFFFASAS